MEDSKRGSVPMQEKHNLSKAQGVKKPSKVNRIKVHWTAVKSILKYLRNTKDMVLVYGEKPETELKVTCYTDVGFQTDKDDAKT
ncbi:hypothetical protein Tco_0952039 [Tanacetum coccineum]|uniref:Uncharacterized protein n=1 Tax=Tanacetum coccineum TaxID=301880 RepID=A0ABQ5DWT3_9ASTR